MAQVNSESKPLARLVRLRHLLQERGQENTLTGEKIVAIVGHGEQLGALAAWAAELQLGYEGFDNRERARHYGEAHAQLDRAIEALYAACLPLLADI